MCAVHSFGQDHLLIGNETIQDASSLLFGEDEL